MPKPTRAFLAAAICLLVTVRAGAYSLGPPVDRVGLCNARPSCRDAVCHDGSGPDVSDLRLESGPLPPTYQPGEVLRFVLSVIDPDPSRARFGFQIAAVTECPFPVQAGAITAVEPSRTQILSGTGIEFLEHFCQAPFDYLNCGYVPAAPGMNSWTFDWQAPATAAAVTLYWAVNSADGSANELGDFISLGEATLSPFCPSRVEPLHAVARACDPGAPGAPRVELVWDPVAGSTGYSIYRTGNALELSDPAGLGAPTIPSACDDPPPTPIEFYNVTGLCFDGSPGPF